MTHQIILKGCALTLLTMALVACGSGGDDVAGGEGSAGPGGGQDTFFAVVKALVTTSPDTAEPRDIDAITVTSPDNTEPGNLDG